MFLHKNPAAAHFSAWDEAGACLAAKDHRVAAQKRCGFIDVEDDHDSAHWVKRGGSSRPGDQRAVVIQQSESVGELGPRQ
jgi:hypothetical protein